MEKTVGRIFIELSFQKNKIPTLKSAKTIL